MPTIWVVPVDIGFWVLFLAYASGVVVLFLEVKKVGLYNRDVTNHVSTPIWLQRLLPLISWGFLLANFVYILVQRRKEAEQAREEFEQFGSKKEI